MSFSMPVLFLNDNTRIPNKHMRNNAFCTTQSSEKRFHALRTTQRNLQRYFTGVPSVSKVTQSFEYSHVKILIY